MRLVYKAVPVWHFKVYWPIRDTHSIDNSLIPIVQSNREWFFLSFFLLTPVPRCVERSGLEKKKRLENNSDDTDIDQSTQASLAGFGAGGAFWNKLLESCVCGSGRKEKTSSLPCTHRTQTLRMARHPLAKSSGFRLPEIWNHMHRWCGRFNTQSFMYRKPDSSKRWQNYDIRQSSIDKMLIS